MAEHEHHHGHRYALYLRTSSELREATVKARTLLREHHGARAASLLPPHMPIKGFFLSAVPGAALIQTLRTSFSNWAPVPVHFTGIKALSSPSLAWNLALTPDGLPNPELYGLQARVFTVILPVVSMHCDFTHDEPFGMRVNAWTPSVPLSYGDLDASLISDATELIAPVAPPRGAGFQATVLDLYEFHANWEASWTGGMTWRHLAAFPARLSGERYPADALLRDEVASWTSTSRSDKP